MAHGLRCSKARGIFPNQGLNPCPLHWQVNCYPLCYQRSPDISYFLIHFKVGCRTISTFPPSCVCVCVCVCVAQLCPNLCDPVDHSPPGYYVHGILQARTLEWVPFAPPGESSWSGCHSLPQGNLPDPGIEPGSPALQADSLPPELLGKPLLVLREMQVKITMTYPYTPIRKGKIRNCSNTKCW